jgi:hypothetical protein
VIEGELRMEKLVLANRAKGRTYDWKMTIHQGSAADVSIAS